MQEVKQNIYKEVKPLIIMETKQKVFTDRELLILKNRIRTKYFNLSKPIQGN